MANAARHKGVSGLPSVWLQYSGYYDYQARKKKNPTLNARKLTENANILLGMVSKPVLKSKELTDLKSDVDGLATTMSTYADVLKKASADNVNRQHLSTVVRPLSQFSNLEMRKTAKVTDELTDDEKKLQASLDEAGDFQPILFDECTVLGKQMTPLQRHRFLRSFKLHRTVEIYSYDLGGSIGTMVFMWRVSSSISENDRRTALIRAVEELKPLLHQYHTQEMRRIFASKCNNISAINPHLRRFLYGQLTGDTSSPSNPDIDYRMRLIALEELPELAADFRHLNEGRPGKFDVFLDALQGLIQDATAEDERRRGIAHLSHFISLRDLHYQAKERCPPDAPIPSLDRVRLQFQPKFSQSRSALKYTGRLNVRYCLQARQLRSVHEDDHYCQALFKMHKETRVQ